ncbi:MAG: type II toxin-antitoxin system ParD family antitoxin [Aquabacterium sp.]
MSAASNSGGKAHAIELQSSANTSSLSSIGRFRQGRYASASEVIRDALRVLEDREKLRRRGCEALRADIQKGARSGQAIAAETVFAGVRERLAQAAQAGAKQSGEE